MLYVKKLIILCMFFNIQGLVSSQIPINYEQASAASQALWNYSTSGNSQALAQLKEIFNKTTPDTQDQILAEVKDSGFNSVELGLIKKTMPQQQPRIQAESKADDAVLLQYIAPEILRNFTADDKKRYLKIIERAKKEGDEGWVKFQVKRELREDKLDQPQAQKPQQPILPRQQLPKPAIIPQPEQKQQAAPGSDFTVLAARTVGEGEHLWDCTWEVLKNASYLYKQLKNRRDIPQDISAAPYSDWCAKASEYEKLQMQSDAMEEVINKNKLLGNDYTFVEGDVSQLSADFILNMDTIKKIKKTPGAAFIFLVNPAGHWFTVIAHNAGGKIKYYIADDTPKPIATYKEVVQFLKKLVEE